MSEQMCAATGCSTVLSSRAKYCSPTCRQRMYLPGYRTANIERVRETRRGYEREYKFGVSAEGYEAQLDEQGGGCAICGGVNTDRGLAVDHDHACCSGKRACGKCNRGLLCSACNTALGKFHDDPALLRKAALYLEQGGVWKTETR